MLKYILCPDAFLHRRNDQWMLSNPRSRTHVSLDKDALESLTSFSSGASESDWTSSFQKTSGQDCTQDFYGADSLHGDHSGVSKNKGTSKQGGDLFQLLVKRWLIVKEDLKAYDASLAPLESSLDRSHLGTFHQRVGQYLTIEKRLRENERWRWWQDQKFLNNGKEIKPGPYKYVQEAFINDYFSKKNIKGLKVLDFGCGNGFYSAKLADFGADVVGMDTSGDLIEIAKGNYKNKAQFIHLKNEEEANDFLKKSSRQFDMIFMQDVFLLLFEQVSGGAIKGLDQLLKLFHEALKPMGKLYTMEPNCVFFLAGRYGDPQNPYAIVTEYRNQVFNIVPPLTRVIEKMGQAGFGLVEYLHPENRSADGADAVYNNKFCIWDFMCFVALGKNNEN